MSSLSMWDKMSSLSNLALLNEFTPRDVCFASLKDYQAAHYKFIKSRVLLTLAYLVNELWVCSSRGDSRKFFYLISKFIIGFRVAIIRTIRPNQRLFRFFFTYDKILAQD